MLRLVHRYLDLADILEIRDRMIGIGLIGGKALGMLLARAILKRHRPDPPRAARNPRLLLHRFRRFLHLSRPQRHLVATAAATRSRYLPGRPGRSPRANPQRAVSPTTRWISLWRCSTTSVSRRTSSGRVPCLKTPTATPSQAKYDSVFCVNQGSREQRLQALLDTVCKVYASAMSEEALRYRVEPRTAGPRRADGAAGNASLGRALRREILSPDCRRRLLVQPPTCGTRTLTPAPAFFGSSSAWARGQWTVPTTITPASSR